MTHVARPDSDDPVNDVFVPLPRALDARCWLDRKISLRFLKTEDNLKKHLAPLLHFARKVTLIDPHMTCRKERFFNTVQHCAALLGRHFGQDKQWRIENHAGDPDKDSEGEHRESRQDRLARWERELAPVAKHFKKKFRISLWGNNPGKNFHDRYIITDQFGVDARGGLDFLDTSTAANYSGWAALEADDLEQILLTEFDPARSPYRHLGSVEAGP